jgi:hypothetical protein
MALFKLISLYLVPKAAHVRHKVGERKHSGGGTDSTEDFIKYSGDL